MAEPQVAYAQDEYGNPFIVVREQGKKTRAQGTQAIKDHIQAARTVANILRSCFGYEGIDAVKAALRAGEAVSTENIPIKIKLVAPPLYVLVTHSTDKVGGVALMEQALEKIQETIEKSEGKVTVKMKPKAVSAVEDEELAQLMAKVERENTEVQGDDDSEDDE